MADGHGIDFVVSGSTSGLPSAALDLRRSYYITRTGPNNCRFLFFRKVQIMVIVLQILLASIATVASNPTVYDQRQSGKTNVRVELKDAVIIAIGDGDLGGDYDYHYDYSDLTIKPSPPTSTTSAAATTPVKSTTPKVTTTISTSPANVNITQNAAVVLEAENNSIIFPASNAKPGSGSTEPVKIKPSDSYKPDQIPVIVLQEVHSPNKFLPVKTVEKHYIPMHNQFEKTTVASIISAKELPARNCSPGFFLDDHNRCKRIRKPTRERPQLPIGLRFDSLPSNRS